MSRAMVREEARALSTEVRRGALTLGGGVLLFWVLELVDWVVLGGWLDSFGIAPRSASGLLGIFFAPFLHGGIGHLLANTLPFVLLGALTMTRKRMDFWVVSFAGMLSSGLGAWLLGAPNTIHIGASGVIFAYLGFLMSRGFFERRVGAIAMSVAVTWVFGGMLLLVLPMVATGISWQGHLFGFLGGILTSRVLGRGLRKQRGGR